MKYGLDVVHGLLEDGEGVLTGLLGHQVEGTVDDALRDGLLAVEKNLVDELGHETVVIHGIRHNLATMSLRCATRHS